MAELKCSKENITPMFDIRNKLNLLHVYESNLVIQMGQSPWQDLINRCLNK